MKNVPAKQAMRKKVNSLSPSPQKYREDAERADAVQALYFIRPSFRLSSAPNDQASPARRMRDRAFATRPTTSACGSRRGQCQAGRSRKEPEWMPMCAPVLAQHPQGAFGQRYVTVLGPLPVPHVDEHALTVNVSDLQAYPFSHPQSTGIDRAKTSSIALAV